MKIPFIFCLYFWVQQLFSGGGTSSKNTNEIVESPSQGVKMCKSFLGICDQIWYLKR